MCTWIHESDAELICIRFFFPPLSDVLAYCVMLQAFICYCSFVRCSCRARAFARVCVCVVHWHCTAQLSMFNMEKRFRNKIIIIIIIRKVESGSMLVDYACLKSSLRPSSQTGFFFSFFYFFFLSFFFCVLFLFCFVLFFVLFGLVLVLVLVLVGVLFCLVFFFLGGGGGRRGCHCVFLIQFMSARSGENKWPGLCSVCRTCVTSCVTSITNVTCYYSSYYHHHYIIIYHSLVLNLSQVLSCPNPGILNVNFIEDFKLTRKLLKSELPLQRDITLQRSLRRRAKFLLSKLGAFVRPSPHDSSYRVAKDGHNSPGWPRTRITYQSSQGQK